MKYRLLVKPNSREDRVEYDDISSTYNVSVRARPISGGANKAVVSIMAHHLGVPKSDLMLANGCKSKYKTLILSN